MRLLERNAVGEIHLTNDFLGHEIPRYAILSHTWGAQEVLIQDLTDGTGENKLGYKKIRFCGDQAWCDGLQFCWVDTCCIDKPNNTELQEAINSMFRWYRYAAKCYVYLDDVSTPTGDAADRSSWEPAFRKSRWFTRGWTLQELIAPVSVEFFSKEGVRLGTRKSLEHDIHHITGLPLTVLRGTPLSNFSISERLSWVEKRKTTRKEDKAYSLLGLFGIHMPLIYGEGETNAFRRLRKEIGGELPPITIANDATFDSRAEEHNARCHPDTRIDLLHQIRAWVDEPNGECIFWLNGRAGTGKSTISRTVAGQLKEHGVLGASFFFKRGERDRGNATLLFTTIAVQLVAQEHQLASFLKAAIDSDPAAISTKALKVQFEKLIFEPLRRVHSGSQDPCTIAIVIDALDECDHDNDIKLIIYLFSQVKALSSVRLRVFITSRPELPIRLGFKNITGKYQDVALHQIPEPVIEHDIAAYLNYELVRIRESYNSVAFDGQRLPPHWPGKRIQILVRMAIPLFIFAATVCRFIADESWQDPEGQLVKVLNYQSDSELDKLDSTYLPILNQLVVGQTGANRSRPVSEFRRLVGPIVLLAEPLSASALSHLLDIPSAAFTRTLSRLHAVLDVPSSADSPIRLFHLSFRDFLIDPTKRNTHGFVVDEREIHEQLANKCLLLISTGDTLKRDVCSLRLPGICRSEISQETIDAALPPEVQYACRYWVHHWKGSTRKIQDGDLIDSFLTQHLLHWLEALAVLGRISESISMIDDLLSLLDVEKSSNLSAFLRDARRVILIHCSVLAASPLQIYCSAIVFAPEQSVVRRTFRNQIPAGISLLPQVDFDWNACLLTLERHDRGITSVTFSHDSTMLASASLDHTIKLWDAITGSCVATLEGHSRSVNSVAFSHDSAMLVSASHDRTIKLWDVATGNCVATLEGHTGKRWCEGVNSVAFSDDSTLLTSASNDDTIKIWDVATGVCVATLEGHDRNINSVAFSHNSAMLTSGSDDETIKLWNVATWLCVATLKGHNSCVTSVTFSHESTMLASASYDRTIKLWDVATRTCVATLEGHGWWVNSVAFSHDSTMLVSASRDETIKLWDVTRVTCMATFKGHSGMATDGEVTSAVFSYNSTMLASASMDKTIKLWDITIDGSTAMFDGHDGAVSTLVLSHDSTILASAGADRIIRLWDVARGTCRVAFECDDHYVSSVAFSHDSTTLASASKDVINLWDVKTGYHKADFWHEGYCHQILFSHDSKILASMSDDHTIKLWHLETGDCSATLDCYSGGMRHGVVLAKFSHDSKLLVSASDGSIKLWDVATGECTATLEGHNYIVNSVAFSPDSTSLASASDNTYDEDASSEIITMWEVATRTRTATFKGHSGGVYSVVFSGDSTMLASVSEDGTIKLWDIEMIACITTIAADTYIAHLTVDATSSSLHTDIGTFTLGNLLSPSPPSPISSMPAVAPTTAPLYLSRRVCRQGIGLSEDCTWVMWDEHKVLWLPPAYRRLRSVVTTFTIAISSSSGRVILVGFSSSHGLLL
ncbi:vegetative incompatibility protein HET-E-1 [Rhexocercosporidium sp. MPI-PUGE-AT-0058]|nr:vegetative incompatibility protein HET-E-1 [Rhexocercosporidium sp. MPI-PUGE-AT-0058]